MLTVRQAIDIYTDYSISSDTCARLLLFSKYCDEYEVELEHMMVIDILRFEREYLATCTHPHTSRPFNQGEKDGYMKAVTGFLNWVRLGR